MEEFNPKQHFKLNKQENEIVLKFMLNLIQQEYTWREICHKTKDFYMEKFNRTVTFHTVWKKWKSLETEILDDSKRDINKIRSQRIKSLKMDMQEAYTNYQNETSPTLKNKWFETYTSLKNQLDKYFPNSLQPEVKKDEEKQDINITFVST